MTPEWLRRRAPVVHRRARAQALGSFLVAGALVGFAGALVGADRGLDLPLVVGLSVAAALAGAVVFLFPSRVGLGLCYLAVAGGIVAILALVASAGAGSLPLAFGLPLVWVGLYAGYFFAPAAAAVYVVVGVSGYGLIAARLDQAVGVEVFYLAVVALTSAGVSAWLSHHRGLADEDPLTGAYNQRGFARRLEDAVHGAERSGRPLYVGLLDIDHFRRVNEKHGRDHGDRLLSACATRWLPRLPHGATLGRLGSDEFAVVLPPMAPAEVTATLEELRTLAPEGQTCSAGAAPFAPGDSQSMLLARAETALYQAKQAGRDRVVVLGDASDGAAEVWRAVEEEELVVHYQPLFALDTGALVGTEALVRWQHPEQGLLGPGAFLSIAEECGAIHSLDRWVLAEACRQARAWRSRVGDLQMTVNVSPTRLRDPLLVDDVADALRHSGLEPEALVLEITEEALQGDIDAAAAVLWEVRALGVRLAIDDFGTGHSSLGRLGRLPFDVLKIDRSFVSALGAELGGESLLAAIVGMARSLGLSTVAEGVEELEQLEVLRRHGCGYAQGFLLARPADPADLTPKLATLTAPRTDAGPTTAADVATVAPVGGVETAEAAEAAAAAAGVPDLPRDGGVHLIRALLSHLATATDREIAVLTWSGEPDGRQRVWLAHGPLAPGAGEGEAAPWVDTLLRRADEEHRVVVSALAADDEAPVAWRLRARAVAPVHANGQGGAGALCLAGHADGPIDEAAQDLLALLAAVLAEQLGRVEV